jgi:hypothetical protein
MGDQFDAPDPGHQRVLAIAGPAAMFLLTLVIIVVAVWKSSSYDAVIPFGILAVVFGLRVVVSSLPAARVPAQAAARIREGSRLDGDGFDTPSRALLRRAQDAIAVVVSSEVCRAGLLDRAAVSTALAGQESDIAAAVQDQARIRARRAELSPVGAGPMTAAVIAGQIKAAQIAESSIAARVEALEHYAGEVAQADAAYRGWRQAARLARLHGQHLDVRASTAADEFGIAEIETMSQYARAVTLALREPPA